MVTIDDLYIIRMIIRLALNAAIKLTTLKRGAVCNINYQLCLSMTKLGEQPNLKDTLDSLSEASVRLIIHQIVLS
jgi:hypothetical protein